MTAPPRSDYTSFPSASPSVKLTAPPKPDVTTFPSASPLKKATAPPKPDFTDFPSAAPMEPEGDEETEETVLASTAAVCAKDVSEALTLCDESPVCEYVLDPNGDMTDELAPNQDGCVRRCDTPQGAAACGLNNKCHHLVLTCVA